VDQNIIILVHILDMGAKNHNITKKY